MSNSNFRGIIFFLLFPIICSFLNSLLIIHFLQKWLVQNYGSGKIIIYIIQFKFMPNEDGLTELIKLYIYIFNCIQNVQLA